MKINAAAVVAICILLTGGAFAQQNNPRYGLPADAQVIELQSLEFAGHPDRALILWMVKPKRNPFSDEPDEPYTCPDETRGSAYSGPTRVSLIDTSRNRVINTVKIIDVHLEKRDAFDVPYAIRESKYYHVEGKPDRIGERKTRVLFLQDYNGDGKALEFALFDAPFCMGLATTLIGYSETHDTVIQYPIRLEVIGGRKRHTYTSRWGDYLFAEKPIKPGIWKYEIDYRGRGGSLDKYEIRYNPKTQRFEGRLTIQTKSR